MLADLRSDGHEALMHLRSKVSSDGRIVVPRTVGKRLNPGPDDYVHFIVEARSVRFLWKHRRTRTIHSQLSRNGWARPMRRPMPTS